MKRSVVAVLLVLIGLASGACSPEAPATVDQSEATRPSILLVTLDTTRADAIGPATPSLNALAARGLRFEQAISTAPMTLPAHASMLTGLYPSDHGVHENARRLGDDQILVASVLKEAGYTTAAFVSGFPLDRQFGLARGFDHYDDEIADGQVERSADRTTDQVLAYLNRRIREPLFLWVHYFDPHEPYAPPEPFRSRYAEDPYLGEIAFMDREVSRLLARCDQRFPSGGLRILVVGDHGEGLGDHGEDLHGNLLYQGVMRVPLLIAGTGIPAGVRTEPVSIRRVFDTILDWAGRESSRTLLRDVPETALGEAMKPYLQYGWQPQVMAVSGRIKVIRSAETEVYDIRADAAESRNLAGEVELDQELEGSLDAYPLPSAAKAGAPLDQEEIDRLARLGYVHGESQPILRDNAPSPKDMTHLFADLDLASGLFVRREYTRAILIFERVLEQDTDNLMVCIRLAVAYSVLDDTEKAMEYFRRAERIDADSIDLRHYLAMHYFRSGEWGEAEPLFTSVLARMPERLPALECLAQIREQQGRIEEAAELLERIIGLQKNPSASLVKLGEFRMGSGDTAAAIRAFERAWSIDGNDFSHFLELGVCYLADRRFAEAGECLDQVRPSDPGYPMALFKRAQVSVLLSEADREQRIRLAYNNADETTRRLIENELLFRGVALR